MKNLHPIVAALAFARCGKSTSAPPATTVLVPDAGNQFVNTPQMMEANGSKQWQAMIDFLARR